MTKRLAAFLAIALVAGCADMPGNDDRSVAQAVEPSLRAAAAAAEANRDYSGAVQHLGTIYQHRSDDPGIGVALARNLRLSGQPQTAADVMQAQLARTPRDPDLLIEVGKDYLAADRVALAVRNLELARTVAPERWDAHATLAVAFDLSERRDEAAAAYARALALSPDNPVVLNNLALSQALAGRLDEALATIGRAADLPAASVQIRQNLALLLAFKGDGQAAEKLVRHDLPADMAKANSEILRGLAASSR